MRTSHYFALKAVTLTAPVGFLSSASSAPRECTLLHRIILAPQTPQALHLLKRASIQFCRSNLHPVPLLHKSSACSKHLKVNHSLPGVMKDMPRLSPSRKISSKTARRSRLNIDLTHTSFMHELLSGVLDSPLWMGTKLPHYVLNIPRDPSLLWKVE